VTNAIFVEYKSQWGAKLGMRIVSQQLHLIEAPLELPSRHVTVERFGGVRAYRRRPQVGEFVILAGLCCVTLLRHNTVKRLSCIPSSYDDISFKPFELQTRADCIPGMHSYTFPIWKYHIEA